MKTYTLIRIGKLFATKIALEGSGGKKILTLLLDTGSTYTIIPVEVLEALGTSPAKSKDHVRIVTGSGTLMVPRVSVSALYCLGTSRKNFPVIAHTLPPAGPIDGLLGMDFLSSLRSRLDLNRGILEVF